MIIISKMMRLLLKKMNEQLQRQLSSLENLIAIQRDCVVTGDPGMDYMHGMLNGLICARSVISETPPDYHSEPRRARKKNRKVRHKSLRNDQKISHR